MTCRSYSKCLQRAIVDFGADVSFQEVKKKVKEHYNLDLPLSSLQSIVKNHARKISEYVEKDRENLKFGDADVILAEMDGSMVPIVDTFSNKNVLDSRRSRSIRWQEARLCLARDVNKLTPFFYATMGDVERTGNLLHRAAIRAGWGLRTSVHGLGDGAKWIVDQMMRVFCRKITYLVDFYHVSEYLAAAADHSWHSEKDSWRRNCQNLLRESNVEAVLERIRLRLPIDFTGKKEKGDCKEDTPVEKCYKYLNNRKGNLDYKKALENNLPIGSGEIESSHRYIIQKRLKIAGAWWKEETAEAMLNLRILRANNDWEGYWVEAA